ncbi:response regulator transcription factor [Sphaerotilus sp.]|jgi:DNA-binding response OmpR family regulator|uniref:response regulator transcription factor n=1 Tax=Sphaerotilus sp. TaxID=2093942 RepID=UPI0025D39CF0|nr:response regulator [Sphaerotilus sp.]
MSPPRRILLVDDQPDLRKLIRMTLALGEFDVHEAVDGVGALAQAAALRPDLVLLDVMMPGELNGYQVCERIKANPALAGTLVVMLTARGQLSDIGAGQQAGADGYLVKPFSPFELIERVESILGIDGQG